MIELAIRLETVEPGFVALTMPHSARFTQQHGFVHAGIIATGLDTACGYAAFSLMSAEAAVLTVEFKTNLLAPARGNSFEFEGRVVKSGNTITVSEGQAYAVMEDGARKLVATMSATLMAVLGRDIRH